MTEARINRIDDTLIAEPLTIPGCLKIFPRVFRDVRGRFVKTVHRDTFSQYGLTSCFQEQYYSFSRKGVLRGLHVQLPPEEHVKLVACVHGEVLDIVLDLRAGSPTYGKYEQIILDGECGTMVYIPAGVAHGFYAYSDSTLLYHVTSQHNPTLDKGIHWNTVGISWPNKQPILSERDRTFPPFSEFISPFRFNPTCPETAKGISIE
ncbi:dTDP-4-dehydrorhamnose 3,5-epimerase family protein [Cohnella abietis]|uniref:dTDP-4-dehydrorhamnose 3,5-epimerase family protein n=1 Tax=Cohnella abietis TaxID=2507935 RepID=UPI00102E9769